MASRFVRKLMQQSCLTYPFGLGLAGVGLVSLVWLVIQLCHPSTPPSQISNRSQFSRNSFNPQVLEHQWIVNAQQAQILRQEGATLLDARSLKMLHWDRLPGAIAVSWQDFAQPNLPTKGKLLEDDAILTQKLQEIGIFQDKPVVVAIDPQTGWGEDGRIVWMLRTLGHQKAVLVDGGYRALIQAGVSGEFTLASTSPPKGDFVVKRRSDWIISRDQLRGRLTPKNLVIIDTRQAREYAGETPYGEQRGGHIPGAIHLYYQDWLDHNGMLLSREAILNQLAQNGIIPQTEIVAYCTGGVRSAWLTTVLVDLGFDAKNYAGSMWEWSASPPEDYPLVRVRQEVIPIHE